MQGTIESVMLSEAEKGSGKFLAFCKQECADIIRAPPPPSPSQTVSPAPSRVQALSVYDCMLRIPQAPLGWPTTLLVSSPACLPAYFNCPMLDFNQLLKQAAPNVLHQGVIDLGQGSKAVLLDRGIGEGDVWPAKPILDSSRGVAHTFSLLSLSEADGH